MNQLCNDKIRRKYNVCLVFFCVEECCKPWNPGYEHMSIQLQLLPICKQLTLTTSSTTSTAQLLQHRLPLPPLLHQPCIKSWPLLRSSSLLLLRCSLDFRMVDHNGDTVYGQEVSVEWSLFSLLSGTIQFREAASVGEVCQKRMAQLWGIPFRDHVWKIPTFSFWAPS